MSEMAERVAIALYKTYPGPMLPGMVAPEWGSPIIGDNMRKLYRAYAVAAIEEVRAALKASEWKRGPAGGHGERSMPSLDEIFDEALK